jgi:methylamine dehydrogenase heavy chain
MHRLVLVLIALLLPLRLAAEVAVEQTGRVESLPQPPRPHWVWVADLILRRAALIDADEGRFLGLVNGGYGTVMPLFARSRPEIYVPATYYSRGTHGTRTDVVEIYDLVHLALQGEVVIPPKRATNAVAIAHAALSDDDRFLAVFNWTTGTSITIVDAPARRFAGEIETPGCSLVYAAGPRRFLSLCADGAVFTIMLGEDGREIGRSLSAPFFDPRVDPVTEKAVRVGQQWLFVSFDGVVHPVDVSAPTPVFPPTWSLVDDTDRADSWRIGGGQHLAAHPASGRLYALMHRGGPDTHKEPGEEVWIFDIAAQRRVARVPLRNPGLTIYGFPVSGGDGVLGWIVDWLLDHVAPPLVGYIAVTPDERPLLVTASQFSGSLGVYDAAEGGFLRRVGPTGWTSDVLVAPWGGS